MVALPAQVKPQQLENRGPQLKKDCNKISATNITWLKMQSLLVCFHSLKTIDIFSHEIEHLISCKRYSLHVNRWLVDRSLANYFSETSGRAFVLYVGKTGRQMDTYAPHPLFHSLIRLII